MNEKIYLNPFIIIFSKYHDFLDVFFYIKIDKLSSYRFSDYKISLMSDKKLSFNSIYDIFQNELKVLKKYLNDNFIKEFIRSSFFSTTSFILFARKSSEKLHLYVNYRAFNIIIIKNRYSLPLIQKTLSRICRIKIYMILNIIIAFNKLRIIEKKK